MTDGLEEMGLPPLGHNKPPEDSAAKRETLLARAAELVTNVNRWLAERPTIIDAEMAGAAQLQTDQLRSVRDDLRAIRKAEVEPLEALVWAVRVYYRDPLAKVDLALDTMEELNRDWLQRERVRLASDRLQREREADAAIVEAAQADHIAQQPGASIEQQLAAQRANERAAEATDSALRARVTRPQTRGDYAAKAMSLHSNWKARIIEPDVAIVHFRDHPDVRVAALKAIVQVTTKHAKLAKDASKAPPGIEFYNDERAQ